MRRTRFIPMAVAASLASLLSGCGGVGQADAWRAPAVGAGKDMGTITIPVEVDWPPRVLLDRLEEDFAPDGERTLDGGEVVAFEVESSTDDSLIVVAALWPAEAEMRSGARPREAYRYRLTASRREGGFELEIRTWGLVDASSPTPWLVGAATMAVYGHLMAPK